MTNDDTFICTHTIGKFNVLFELSKVKRWFGLQMYN